MPRPRPPPTPNSSTDLKALEKTVQASDMETVFALPPPALRSNDAKSHSDTSKSTMQGYSFSIVPPLQSTPPISPKEKPLSLSPRQKRTASGALKSSPEMVSNVQSNSLYELPPPPGRARKIIQMKPKPTTTTTTTTTTKSRAANEANHHPSVSASGSSSKSGSASTKSKQKPSSTTSAAGRKIARKTAHSIIERRRRNKMNEEFGVLKGMIPACEGVEMHKLAILQAGIDYVRYLEGCVAQLKAENEKWSNNELRALMADEQRAEDDESGDDTCEEHPRQTSPVKRQSDTHPVAAVNAWSPVDSRNPSVTSRSSSSYSSPQLQPQLPSRFDDGEPAHKRPAVRLDSFTISPVQSSMQSNAATARPTPTLLSPAFESVHFSPNICPTSTDSSVSTSAGTTSPGVNAESMSRSWVTVNQTCDPRLSIESLASPQAAMNLPLPHYSLAQSASSSMQLAQPNSIAQSDRDTHSKSPGGLSDVSATAEATAGAALMMLTNEWRGGGRDAGWENKTRAKRMSVRDLLIS